MQNIKPWNLNLSKSDITPEVSIESKKNKAIKAEEQKNTIYIKP